MTAQTSDPAARPEARADVPLTRRALLRSAVAAGGVALLAGCGDGAPPTPTAVAPTAPTVAVPEPSVTGGLDLTAAPATPAATPAAAAPAAPEGSPAATDQARLDQLMAVSAALVGGGQLDPDRGAQYLRLADADPARQTALDRLLASPPDPATSAPARLAYPWDAPAAATPLAATPLAAPPAGSDAAKDLLRFWYLGTLDGAAVEGRDHAWFSLGAWQALRYTAAPSVCKAFGSWATAPAQPA